MWFSKLSNYDFEEVLSIDSQKIWEEAIETIKVERFDVAFKIYKSFIDITKNDNNIRFEINTIDNINNHFMELIGFIYTEFQTKYEIKYKYAKVLFKLFKHIYENDFDRKDCKFSAIIESSYVIDSIKSYSKIKKNNDKIKYYNGWYIICKDTKYVYVNLTKFYKKYGKDYTESVVNVLEKITAKRLYHSSLAIIVNTLNLFKYFIELFPNLKDLNENLNSKNSPETLLKIYNLGVIDAKIKNESIYIYHQRWKSTVFIFYEMVDLNLFDVPDDQILTPIFKTNKSLPKSNIKQNENKDLISIKLITDIPLYYTDSEAKELIFKKIVTDINYIISCAEYNSKKQINKLNDFIKNSKKGIVKESLKGKESDFLSNTNLVGPKKINNVCATYYKYPFTHPQTSSYLGYLGYSKNTKNLKKMLPLSDNDSLYSFLILLINEHPCITTSSLLGWKLFTNGKNTGLFQIGDKWATTMYKRRKGSDLAEQIIFLNRKSKQIIEDIIKLTNIARVYLKERNNSDFEFMLLRSSSLFSPPQRFTDITNLSEQAVFKRLKEEYLIESLLPDNLTSFEAEKLIKNFTLTKFRASCGVRVYLDTTSIEKMSESLGHEKFEHSLMLRYLPYPLWAYFTNRWVRVFQNALIFEAMKDSKFLYEAIDLSPTELDVFLNNHSLGEIPKFLEKNINIENVNNELIGIFPISTPLLQWLIALVEYVKSADSLENLNKIAFKWYQTASLIISFIEVKNSFNSQYSLNINNDVLEMYEFAKKNLLDFEFVRRTLLCKN